MMDLDEKTQFLSSSHQWVTTIDSEKQVIVAERGPIVFVFNFSATGRRGGGGGGTKGFSGRGGEGSASQW